MDRQNAIRIIKTQEYDSLLKNGITAEQRFNSIMDEVKRFSPSVLLCAYLIQQDMYDKEMIENGLETFVDELNEKYKTYIYPITDSEKLEMQTELRTALDAHPDFPFDPFYVWNAINKVLGKRIGVERSVQSLVRVV